MKIALIALTGFVLLTVFGCERNKNATGPAPTRILSISDLRNLVTIEFADYDSMIIRNSENTTFPPSFISRIEMGQWDTGEYSVIESTVPFYIQREGNSRFSFALSHKITNDKLKAYFFTLRFWQGEEDFVDVDTFALTYKFPYKTTEIFLETDQFFYPPDFAGWGPFRVQDFELVGNNLYFYSLGPTIVWKCDLTTRQVSFLYDFGGGDHVTGDSTYLFLDLMHHAIYRYDVKKDTMDMQFQLPAPYVDDIRGLGVSDGKLFAMFPGEAEDKSLLVIYDFQGNMLDQQQIPFVGYCLTVQDDILYSSDWVNRRVLRYDLTSQSNLPDLRFPSEEMEGIKIYGDKFYFADYNRQTISVASLAEMISKGIGASPSQTQQLKPNALSAKTPHDDEEF